MSLTFTVNQLSYTTGLFGESSSMTATEFKEKHGEWLVIHRNDEWNSLYKITHKYTEAVKVNYPHLSLTVIHNDNDKQTLYMLLGGATSLEYQRFLTRTGEPLLTLKSGYKVFNFKAPIGNQIDRMNEKLSAQELPPAYTEEPQPQQEPKDALAAAWKEIEEAKKQIEEAKKQIEEEKIKMKLRAKMTLFDEEIAKFKQQFFTQDELVCIRKTFDERF